ncbi:DUF2911 domain-containing protein [Chryseolinea sp. H1M3-3]|uniref:DUF2911 domain-containing protein n=1 Tax=Chryseolinea sp. H1M3-3 TaxID=3034144 RepID=UPI0023EB74C9|nr:DUF2911 domain-containing protein [Chryseolinea sp. H1M3-3]
MIQRNSFILMLLMVCAMPDIFGQEPVKPRPSPIAIIAIRYKDAYIKITYSQPQKRDRDIFGKLVPYDQVWRTGANEATEITTTKNIQINGTLLKAGTYSLFTIPQKDKWTVIINSEVGLWGAYNYNSKLDVMRFDVPVTTTDMVYESFTMQFDHRNEVADLLLYWDKTKISIPIKFIN